MKTFVPRLIAWGVLLLLGVVVTLSNYSSELLILVALTMAAVTVGMLVGKNHDLVKDLPWLAGGAVMLAILIPTFGLTIDSFDYADGSWVSYDAPGIFRTGMIMAGIATLVLNILFRKRANLVFIGLRYALLGVAMLCARQVLFNDQPYFFRPLVVLLLLSLMYELNTAYFGVHRPRLGATVCISIAFILIVSLCGYKGLVLVDSLFMVSNAWLYMTVAVAILGGLLIMEQVSVYNLRLATYAHPDLGGVLLFWSALSLIMHLWPATNHWMALVLPSIFLYYMYNLLVRPWAERNRVNKRTVFLITWSIITVLSLVMGKSLNSDPLVAIVIVVLIIAGAACWYISEQRKNGDLLIICYLGVAATVLLAAVALPSLTDMLLLARTLLSVGIISTSWCILCTTVKKLNDGASKIYPQEFKLPMTLLPYAPMVVLAISVIWVLAA